MKNKNNIERIILFSGLIFGLTTYAQTIFEKGYDIDNDSKKVDCFIINKDWLNNPTEFNYKLVENSPQNTTAIKSVKEFEISNKLKCRDNTLKDLRNVKYQNISLAKFLVNYNQSQDSDYFSFKDKEKKKLFNLSLRAGYRKSLLRIGNENYNWNKIDLGSSSGYRVGMEAEMTLPFYNEKWSLLLESVYQYVKCENTTILNKTVGTLVISNFDYTSIEIPIGLRYYYSLNEYSKLYVNGFVSFNWGINSTIRTMNEDNLPFLSPLKVNKSSSAGLGIGYKYKNRYSVELRCLRSKNILNSHKAYNSDYHAISFILGYSLFNSIPE
ncbi:outer membrane beta-barrel protein [Bacteroidota bacterium]